MKLSQYRETYYIYSGKLSDVVRQLAFAGIAIIWVFKQEAKPIPKIPEAMLLPLVFLVFSLAADLLHYVAATVIWGSFHRYHESKVQDKHEDPELSAPSYYNWPALTFFAAKSLFLVIAYALLVKYLLGVWLSVVTKSG